MSGWKHRSFCRVEWSPNQTSSLGRRRAENWLEVVTEHLPYSVVLGINPTDSVKDLVPGPFIENRWIVGSLAIDVTVCRKCGGRMRVLEVVDTADDIACVLHGARAPPRPILPARLYCSRPDAHPGVALDSLVVLLVETASLVMVRGN